MGGYGRAEARRGTMRRAVLLLMLLMLLAPLLAVWQ